MTKPFEILFGFQDVINNPTLIPTCNGIYYWWFKSIPSQIDLTNCQLLDGHYLLYTGIATDKIAKPNSRYNLRKRLLNHCRGTARISTLRLTLGCLLYAYGISPYPLRRMNSISYRPNWTFGAEGEKKLNTWMAQNAKIGWTCEDQPWVSEQILLDNPTIGLPLNIRGNSHPFTPTLRLIRKTAKRSARDLPFITSKLSW